MPSHTGNSTPLSVAVAEAARERLERPSMEIQTLELFPLKSFHQHGVEVGKMRNIECKEVTFFDAGRDADLGSAVELHVTSSVVKA